MADLEALSSNLALARQHVDQNDTVTASLYYETTLQYMHRCAGRRSGAAEAPIGELERKRRTQ